jgi:hypothetical protein
MDFKSKDKLRKHVSVLMVLALFSVLALFMGCDVDVENDEDTADFTIAYYRDADGDLFGDPTIHVKALTQPVGYINNSLDCDDTDANINPNATETPADTVDSNCDGSDDT